MVSSGEKLVGKVALITGASRGIGRAAAVELGRMGAQVMIGYRTGRDAAERTLAEALAAGAPRGAIAQADVGDRAECDRLVATCEAELGGVDLLVNNAGLERRALLHAMSDDDWRAVIRVCQDAVFYLCRAALPGMLTRRWGRIVNVASVASVIPHRGSCAYVAAKHAVVGLTKALALETAGKGVLVNAVAPGPTDTDMLAVLTPEQKEKMLRLVPLGSMATATQMGRLIAWVAGEADYSTGNVFHASGGVVMG
jgi:NAD(P)-dependent dehydrogenase (short-subunit alcohol dehydrogenase family)